MLKKLLVSLSLLAFTLPSLAGTLAVRGKTSDEWFTHTHIYSNIDKYTIVDNILHTYVLTNPSAYVLKDAINYRSIDSVRWLDNFNGIKSGHYKSLNIVIYYTSYCGACHKLMNKLDKAGIGYKKVNIENSKSTKIKYVPTVIVNGKTYVGATEAWNAIKKLSSSKKMSKVSGAEYGIGSYYGPGFHGRTTANGEKYNQHGISCAHKTLPLGSFVKITNLNNGKSYRARINDRGPYIPGRIIDLSVGLNNILNCDLCKVKVERA